MAVSANFGDMFSTVGASLCLPFLPPLPKQVLLMNVMIGFSEMSIASDRVDHEWIERPKRWDIMAVGVEIPFSPLGRYLGFTTLPPPYWLLPGLTLVSYVLLAQGVKMWLLRRKWI